MTVVVVIPIYYRGVDRLALIGVSHRRGGAAALEAWQHYFDQGQLHCPVLGLSEWVLLKTCNRWDLVLVLPEGVDLGQARAHLTPPGQSVKPYVYAGEAALEQLIRVTASLDSLNPGEDQIIAQVRAAYRAAQQAKTTGTRIAYVFHTALRIAKKVRRSVALAPANTSLFSLARPTLERYLPTNATVAVLGAGEMGTLAAKTLASRPHTRLLVVNRSPARAEALAQQVGAESLSLAAFLADPPEVDALVCATPVEGLVGPALLERLPNLRAIVDLGVPRNTQVGVGPRFGVLLLDVDSLQSAGAQRRSDLAERLAEAEGIVRCELELAMCEWTERQLGPSIKRLRDWYLATIGDTLPPQEAERLAHKFAHVPVKGLRAVAREHGLEAAKTFLAETGLL